MGQTLRRGDRLVTLTGPGGVGKTRLALEVATELRDDFRDGVWLVELAPVIDPRRVPHAVAVVLGLQEEPPREMSDTLAAALRGRNLLLVLDNCEHLLDATAGLALRLLATCPRLSVLVTSRESLGVTGEVTWRVAALALQPASELFEQRALAAAPGFQSTGVVEQICRRLDGLPLAIELAAARVPSFGVDHVAAKLDDSLRLLGAARARTARHQTLRATLDWSYDLLDPAERTFFARLAVFGGGWSLEAAEAVCGDAYLLARLVDKSLVVAEEDFDGMRWYRFLETIRVYAAEKLQASADEAAARDLHLAFYTELAERADHWLRRSTSIRWCDRRVWLSRMIREVDNLRLAVDWACRNGDATLGLRLGGALLPFLYTTGYLGEGRQWLARLLATLDVGIPSLELGQAIGSACKLAADHGDDASCFDYARAFFALPAEFQSAAAAADAHGGMCIAETRRGDLAAAVAHGQDAVRMALLNNDPINAALYRYYLANALQQTGDLDAATSMFECCVADASAVDFQLAVGLATEGLAGIARARAEWSAARRMGCQALSLFREMGSTLPAAFSLIGLGQTSLAVRDVARARGEFGEALEIALELGQWQQQLLVLDAIAELALAVGQGDHAARLRLAVDRLRIDSSFVSQEQALSLAREVLSASPRQERQLLSTRELEVVELLASGLSNRAIAERLVLSVRTVDRHVENILGKLGLSSRSQVVAWALTHNSVPIVETAPKTG